MNSLSPHMPDIISEHRHPQPRLRRLAAWLNALGLLLIAAAVVIQVVLALLLGSSGLLFFGTGFFTGVLALPLLLQSVLHPEITITTGGLRLRPLLWRAQFVPWSALKGMARHPLLQESEATSRLLYGRRHRPRQGAVILVDRSAGLLPLYRILGGLSGAPGADAFAITDRTHAGYAALHAHLEARIAQ